MRLSRKSAISFSTKSSWLRRQSKLTLAVGDCGKIRLKIEKVRSSSKSIKKTPVLWNAFEGSASVSS